LNEQSSEIKANIALINAAIIFNPIEELTIKNIRWSGEQG